MSGHIQQKTRPLTQDESAAIEDVLKRLREHFHEWPELHDSEYELVGFAYYEGCGGTDCCGAILYEAAPLALGKELVTKHGARWSMLQNGDAWHYAVEHDALNEPIDLLTLEEGHWIKEMEIPYDSPPSPGAATFDSLECIAKAIHKKS